MTSEKTRSEKFKEAARELGCDEDEARREDRLRKVAQQKPGPLKGKTPWQAPSVSKLRPPLVGQGKGRPVKGG